MTTICSGRHAVQRQRLVSLRLVPDEDAVGNVPKNGLARQVIPAPHAERGRIAERLRGLQVVELRRSDQADQRREQHDVGGLFLKVLVDLGASRDRSFARSQGRPHDSSTSRGPRSRDEQQPQPDSRYPLPRSRPQLRCTGVCRIEVPQVVDRHAELDRKVAPAHPHGSAPSRVRRRRAPVPGAPPSLVRRDPLRALPPGAAGAPARQALRSPTRSCGNR